MGVSEAKVAAAGTQLVTSGLGSCLGVAVYDPHADVGALLHAMLPESANHPGPPEKFVVDGIDATLAALDEAGADRSRLRAKLAGASSMLELETEDQTVGEQNVAAAREALRAHRIPVEATDVGGSDGRSLQFTPGDGRLVVSSAGGQKRVL